MDVFSLQMLLGHEPIQDERSSYRLGFFSPLDVEYSRSLVAPSLYEVLLPRLCSSGRFVWLLDTEQPVEEGVPLRWDDGEPWRFQLNIVPDDNRQLWHISGQLCQDGRTVPLRDVVLLLAEGAVLFQDRLARLRIQEISGKLTPEKNSTFHRLHRIPKYRSIRWRPSLS